MFNWLQINLIFFNTNNKIYQQNKIKVCSILSTLDTSYKGYADSLDLFSSIQNYNYSISYQECLLLFNRLDYDKDGYLSISDINKSFYYNIVSRFEDYNYLLNLNLNNNMYSQIFIDNSYFNFDKFNNKNTLIKDNIIDDRINLKIDSNNDFNNNNAVYMTNMYEETYVKFGEFIVNSILLDLSLECYKEKLLNYIIDCRIKNYMYDTEYKYPLCCYGKLYNVFTYFSNINIDFDNFKESIKDNLNLLLNEKEYIMLWNYLNINSIELINYTHFVNRIKPYSLQNDYDVNKKYDLQLQNSNVGNNYNNNYCNKENICFVKNAIRELFVCIVNVEKELLKYKAEIIKEDKSKILSCLNYISNTKNTIDINDLSSFLKNIDINIKEIINNNSSFIENNKILINDNSTYINLFSKLKEINSKINCFVINDYNMIKDRESIISSKHYLDNLLENLIVKRFSFQKSSKNINIDAFYKYLFDIRL